MKGQKMLKVCGILMIIGAAIGLVLGIVAALGLSLLVSGLGGGAVAIVVIATIIACVGAIVQLAAGIVGVKAANMPSVGKMKAAFVLGLIVIILTLCSSILTAASSGFDVSSVVSLIIGLIIPVLYMVGLIQYKNALLELLGGGDDE